MSSEVSPMYLTIIEANLAMEGVANTARQKKIDKIISKVRQKMEEKCADSAGFLRFRKVISLKILNCGNEMPNDVDVEFLMGSGSYAELDKVLQTISAVADEVAKNSYLSVEIPLSDEVGTALSEFEPDSVRQALKSGVAGGVVKTLGIFGANCPGYRQEDWVNAQFEAEYTARGWEYLTSTGIDGINVMFAFPDTSVEPNIAMVVNRV